MPGASAIGGMRESVVIELCEFITAMESLSIGGYIVVRADETGRMCW